MIMADLGADVIKVEPVSGGDMIRSWGPFDQGESVYYLSSNHNKRSLALNFRSPEGLVLLRRLALQSDVIVENFKPGTLSKMGLNPGELRAERPEIIIASVSGFGSSGPLADRPGFDQIAQGYSGLMSVTGSVESGPVRTGVAIGDLTSSLWIAIGILAAWISRQKSGKGMEVETSLLASLVSLTSVQGQRYLNLGDVPGPSGNVHPVIAPYGVFTAGDGELNIGAATQGMWLRLCDVINRPDLKADDRFVENADRMAHRDELKEIIEGELVHKGKAVWTELLVKAGIPAGPINTVEDVFNDVQVRHLGLVQTVKHPRLGDLPQISLPINLDGHGLPKVNTAPPDLGEHSEEILSEFGLANSEILMMREKGIIG
ncbi:CoA transferase [Roseovarius pacificus]|nr:CoA transferase [Roseovarius pacificus]